MNPTPLCQYRNCKHTGRTTEHTTETGIRFYCSKHDKPHFHTYRHRETFQ
jgi:hypothetical protein